MVGGFEAQDDVLDAALHRFSGTVPGLVAVLGGPEVVPAVVGDVPAQPLPLVEKVDLGPEVEQAVRPWRAGQLDHFVDAGAHRLEGFEPLGGMVLEAGCLVQNHHVKVPAPGQCVNQPGDVLAVDDVNIRWGFQCGFALLLCAQHGGNAQVLQVLPFLCLILPRRLCDLLRGDDERSADLQPVVDQLVDGGQRDHRLAQAHLHPERHPGLLEDRFDARLLIRVRVKLLHCFDLRFF